MRPSGPIRISCGASTKLTVRGSLYDSARNAPQIRVRLCSALLCSALLCSALLCSGHARGAVHAPASHLPRPLTLPAPPCRVESAHRALHNQRQGHRPGGERGQCHGAPRFPGRPVARPHQRRPAQLGAVGHHRRLGRAGDRAGERCLPLVRVLRAAGAPALPAAALPRCAIRLVHLRRQGVR